MTSDAPAPLRVSPTKRIAVWAIVAVSLVVLFQPNETGAAAEGAALPGPAQRLAAVTILMAGLWVTQALPIPVTALIPLVAFPLCGIQTASEVASSYIDKNVFLFLGGFVVALGIERWGLHRRIALRVVSHVGSSPRRIVLGFMLATAFLSMWISNTAATLLMLPIALALLESIGTAVADEADARAHAAIDRLGVVLLLAVAYSASVGGFSTLVGTPTNVAFAGIWEKQLFPDGPAFSAGTWMAAVLPIGVVMLAFTWGILVWGLPAVPNAERLTRGFFRERLERLGRMSVPERRMALVFAATAILWMTRSRLEFGSWTLIDGWGHWLEAGLAAWDVTASWNVTADAVDDSTVAIGMTVLLFAVPAGAAIDGEARPRLMDWPTAVRLPWDVLLLFGGGLALAGAFRSTGLSEWLGSRLATGLEGQPLWLVVLAVCVLMTFLTEVTSNVATVSALVPVLAPAAVGLGVDPRLVCIPAVISASCAFTLPIATPPNAIVFGSGRVSMGEMVRYGVLLNLIGAVVITLLTFACLVPQFGISLDALPEWAAE